jgi:hypothetical protein
MPLASNFSSCAATEKEPEPISLIRSGSLAVAMHGVARVALHPRGRLVRIEEGKDADSLRMSVDSAVTEHFRDYGYVIVGPDRADVLVAYAVGVTGQLDDAALERAFGVAAGMDLGDGVQRGALVMTIVNRRTGLSRWRASASAPAENLPVAERDSAIQGAVAELLRGLPKIPRWRAR